ncbi:MAG: EAL domain-containing protein [Candidatus Nanopelagicales bacterium]
MRVEEDRKLPYGVAFVGIAIFSVLMLLPALPGSTGNLISSGVRTITALIAGVFFLFMGYRAEGTLKRSRILLGAGIVVAGIGTGSSNFVELSSGSAAPVPSVPDLIYFASLPLIVIGLLYYPMSPNVSSSKLRALLDGAIAATAIWIVAYTLILIPSTQASGTPSISELRIVAYPAASIFVFGIAASMLLRVSGLRRREFGLVAAGLGAVAVAEIARSILLANGVFSSDSWLAVMSEIGLVLLLLGGVAAMRGRTNTAAESSADAEAQAINDWTRGLPFLPFVTVGVALLIALIAVSRGYSMTAVGFDSGVVLIMLLLAQQLTSNRELASLNNDLRKSSELFESLVVGSSDLITLHEPDGRLKYASPAVFRMLDMEPAELLGKPLSFVVHPDDLPKLAKAHEELRRDPSATAQLDLRVGRPVPDVHGSDASARVPMWRWVDAVAHNLIEDGAVHGIVCNTRDIHEQQLLRQRLSYEAYHDTLTGLGNLALARRIFAEQCYGPNRAPVTLVLADLDGFKTINDTFGHAFGDDVLVAVARRIRLSVTDEDQVARIGGDEFVFILDSAQDAVAAANEILDAIRRPFMVQGSTVNVAASFGIARSVDAVDSVELLRNADLAMYSAKASGGSRVVTYDPAMHEETAHRLRIQDGLRRALEDSSFELHYQPIVSLPSGNVVGAEALLRWEDTKLGRMFPDVFIPIAEGSGISAEIDEWVVREACSQLRKWWDSGVDIKQVSVNISRRQLSSGLAAVVRRALDDNQLPARALCVEVTESAVVSDAEQAREALEEIRAMGICVALDDFGTGESSLSQLSTLPVDRVKIDKSFVMPSSADSDALRLLESIVGVCRTIGMPIVAEGVEDEAAVANLSDMGVDLAQGYFFFRPLPASEVEASVLARIPDQRTSRENSRKDHDDHDNVIYTKFG